MKKFFLITAGIILVLVLSSVFYVISNLSPVSTDTKTVTFVINKGDGIVDVAQKLQSNRLIKDKYSFIAYAVATGQNQKIPSGTFRLSPSLSVKEILVNFAGGGISDYWIKIIDGFRVEEIAPLFPEGLSFTPSDFLAKARSKEGRLFPDSYLLPKYYNLDQVLNFFDQNFTKKISQAKSGSRTTLSDNDNLILASLVEREGRSLAAKKMIAGILLNRLNINMPLQVDASVQYARDSRGQIAKYWQPVTRDDLKQIDSDYNTYLYPQLPPGPICNPGYDSIYAVYHPTDSDYLYYITGNDNQMHYAKTLDQHNQNIANYLR
jgi:UPF0755 protein